jgi:hypothetical protein
VNRYHAVSAHDATGLGNVIVDLVDERSIKVELIQQKRTKLLTEYIADFENGCYIWPLNPPEHENGAWTSPAYEAHRATTVADVYGNQQVLNAHLPDDVAAAAIMHRAAERAAPNAAAVGVPKSAEPPSAFKVFQASPSEVTIVGPQGDVRIMDSGPQDGVGVAWVPDSKGTEWGVFNL